MFSGSKSAGTVDPQCKLLMFNVGKFKLHFWPVICHLATQHAAALGLMMDLIITYQLIEGV